MSLLRIHRGLAVTSTGCTVSSRLMPPRLLRKLQQLLVHPWGAAAADPVDAAIELQVLDGVECFLKIRLQVFCRLDADREPDQTIIDSQLVSHGRIDKQPVSDAAKHSGVALRTAAENRKRDGFHVRQVRRGLDGACHGRSAYRWIR